MSPSPRPRSTQDAARHQPPTRHLEGAVTDRRRKSASSPRPMAMSRGTAAALALVATTDPGAKANLTERVADSIIAYILEEGLSDGDVLPAEGVLAERYEVSRTAVREAIAHLAGRGMVLRRQGKESIVVTPGHTQLHGLLAFRILRHGVSPEEVQETRRAVESITAALAAERRTDAHLGAMRDCLALMRSATRDADFHDADVRFHSVLAEASENRLILLVFEAIEGLVRENRIRATAGRRSRGESFEPVIAAHRAVYDAVEARDPVAAESAMLAHLRQTEEGLSVLRGAPPRRAARPA